MGHRNPGRPGLGLRSVHEGWHRPYELSSTHIVNSRCFMRDGAYAKQKSLPFHDDSNEAAYLPEPVPNKFPGGKSVRQSSPWPTSSPHVFAPEPEAFPASSKPVSMKCLRNLVASQVAHGFEVFSEQQLLVLNDPTRVARAVLVCILDIASFARRAAECSLGRDLAESGHDAIALMFARR